MNTATRVTIVVALLLTAAFMGGRVGNGKLADGSGPHSRFVSATPGIEHGKQLAESGGFERGRSLAAGGVEKGKAARGFEKG